MFILKITIQENKNHKKWTLLNLNKNYLIKFINENINLIMIRFSMSKHFKGKTRTK